VTIWEWAEQDIRVVKKIDEEARWELDRLMIHLESELTAVAMSCMSMDQYFVDS